MDINVVGIYLDESTYKGVYILDIVGTSHDFSTGNPVKDFADALKFAKKIWTRDILFLLDRQFHQGRWEILPKKSYAMSPSKGSRYIAGVRRK